MSLIQLSSEELNNSIGLLQSTTNEGVIQQVGVLAEIFRDSGDDNELLSQGKEAAIKFQKQYNEYVESVALVIEEAKTLIDLDEYLKRADMGEVSNRSLSFEVAKADTSRVIQ
jgi:hypothetical protein